MCFKICVALLHEIRLLNKKETQLFLVAEYVCVKISVAFLCQRFQPFSSFFSQNLIGAFKISVALLHDKTLLYQKETLLFWW